MNGAGYVSNPRYDVRSRWSVSGEKQIGRSAREIEGAVEEAVTSAFGPVAGPPARRSWTLARRRPLSLFDQCEIEIALVGEDGAPTSTVEVEIRFDASAVRSGLVAGLATSIVGLPLGLGWRWQSVQGAKRYAQTTIDALWEALDASVARTPVYR